MGTMRKLKRQVRQNRRNAMKQYTRTASVSIRAEKKRQRSKTGKYWQRWKMRRENRIRNNERGAYATA